ncbi:PQQ-dependent sugar dehydrogenase [Histidinibacterium aquaticum]|uniref:PQQ-dependent sugar dehydrogenase n=1 Tax=Histidinibacterium aquaticum TaxID=2613962 RepID=A0A5J5GBB7_9RHOB|nr:PQQ-dependent sugar dehydrogenase [Histidinibacterium aquaticum]KAA9004774.1 PQQ-dependent sugar dehydrogenase [Histidinibacterium aquaticum]
MKQITKITLTTALAAGLGAPALAQSDEGHQWGTASAPFEPAFPNQTRAPIEVSDVTLEQETITGGLVHPWAVEALPGDEGFLVTERTGNLRHVSMDGEVSEPISGVPEVYNENQGGLLDVKMGPTFDEDRMVYMTYSKTMGDEMSATAAARGVLSEDLTEITEVEDIWVQDPPSPTPMHYGSRIVFDGDDIAFITTGEHSSLAERDFAQHMEKTYGKIIRIHTDGSIPENNPYVDEEYHDDAIWSYGHRNVQSAAMHDGFLFTIEHGPAGGDELNMPLPTRNYGWPIVSYGVRYNGPLIGSGEPRMPGMEEPLYYWDPVIAPGDMLFYEGEEFADWEDDLFVGGLVAPGIVRLGMQGALVTEEERLLTDLGRVRDIEVLEDGSFVLATDYEDGELIHVTSGSDS